MGTPATRFSTSCSRRLATEPACLALGEATGFALDNIRDFNVESVPDEVPARACLMRIGEASFAWVGHLDDWQARLQLLQSIKGRPTAVQYLDYETPGDASVLVEFVASTG